MRKLKKEEYDLILFLLKDIPQTKQITEGLFDRMVEEMDDERMGSLRFLSNTVGSRKFGRQLTEISLLDMDGTPVSFAINLDNEDDIFELDVFKADSSPLRQFPTPPYNKLPPSMGGITLLV